MSAAELLAAGGTPTRREIEELLSGHLCRCTGYETIVDAIAEVAGTERVNLGEHLLACAERHPEALAIVGRRAAGDLRRAALGARARRPAAWLRVASRPGDRVAGDAQESHRDGRPVLGRRSGSAPSSSRSTGACGPTS